MALLSACSGNTVPDASKAPLRPVSEIKDLAAPGAAPEVASQLERMKWERPGQWRQAQIGGGENVLVARDRFGDRILAKRAGGYAVWTGKIDCPAGRAVMDDGVLYSGAKHASAGAYRQQGDQPGLCGDDGRPIEGAPVQVATNIEGRKPVGINVTPEMLRKMDADAAAGRPPVRPDF